MHSLIIVRLLITLVTTNHAWKAGLWHEMLLSTKIFIRKGLKTTVVREWTVVNVPDEECRRTDLLALYNCICNHEFDKMEPYFRRVDAGSFPVWAMIGNAQNTNKLQDIPLNVCVPDAVSAFGLYIKYIVLVDGESIKCTQGVTGHKRNAFEVHAWRVFVVHAQGCRPGHGVAWTWLSLHTFYSL